MLSETLILKVPKFWMLFENLSSSFSSPSPSPSWQPPRLLRLSLSLPWLPTLPHLMSPSPLAIATHFLQVAAACIFTCLYQIQICYLHRLRPLRLRVFGHILQKKVCKNNNEEEDNYNLLKFQPFLFKVYFFGFLLIFFFFMFFLLDCLWFVKVLTFFAYGFVAVGCSVFYSSDSFPLKPCKLACAPADPPPAQSDDTNGREWARYLWFRFSSDLIFSARNQPNSPGVHPYLA